MPEVQMVTLPTSFLDVLRDIREEAEKYGRVTEVCRHGAHAYIEFEEASDCQRACTGLTGRNFDGKPILATFYPARLWAQKIFVFWPLKC